MSGGVEWALHCCVVLTGMAAPVPAARLAEFHDVSPTYLAKQLQALSRAGLVRSVQGQAGGYVLTRAAEEISVLDVVEAVDGSEPAFICTEIRQRGPFAATPDACRTPCGITRVMIDADRAWRESLRATSIADLAGTVARDVGAETLPRAQAWIAQRT
ncbi:MAG: Rrf2 family transcriptional regulator [Pseudonocardia sp. SCN 73-27]|uniref:RrF2 family transcriptional regulator n=1 Tax=unclassified Pseudonocardia TaxID=2619320 RepID=UPI00086AC999|nr:MULTISPECIES: Rrf2 family transcriptional regulator [unclassified Pseudonocardia]ODU25945.1 MAG: Rrf2 family transcriptional regulator [Pseudonocardia sp. SCN 72-51]ODV08803.1 MAG: Rrf2 family transcriptional regulator [Pseudonocardia sp. SCN 73-27]